MSDAVVAVFDYIRKEGLPLGFCINESKTEVCFLNPDVSPESPHFGKAWIMKRSEMSLLGASFGSSCAIASSVAEKSSKLQTVCSYLKFLGAHQSLALMKNCLMIPKPLYILRASPCLILCVSFPFLRIYVELFFLGHWISSSVLLIWAKWPYPWKQVA